MSVNQDTTTQGANKGLGTARLKEVPNDLTDHGTLRAFLTDMRNHIKKAGAAPVTVNNLQPAIALKEITVPLTVKFGSSSSRATGAIRLGKSFSLREIKMNAAARVRLYSKDTLRDLDKARTVSTLPTAFTQHGLIFDGNYDASFAFPLDVALSPEAPGSDRSDRRPGLIPYTIETYQNMVVPAFNTLGTNAAINSLAGIGNPIAMRWQFASYAGIYTTVVYTILIWCTKAPSSGDYGTDVTAGIVTGDPNAGEPPLMANTTAVQGVFGAKTNWTAIPADAVDWCWQITDPTLHNFTNSQYDYSNVATRPDMLFAFTILQEEL